MNKLFFAACIYVTLSGCVSIQSDRGSYVSESLIAERSVAGKSVSIGAKNDHQQRLQELLAKPLTADAAVQVALLNNPRMQLLYAELGVAQAELYDASRLANPSFGAAQLSADGVVTKTTLNISQRFTELLFLHFNTRMARSEVLQAQQRVASEVLALEADVRSAYGEYVAARMAARMRERVAVVAAASSQYAEQLHTAGNITQLQLSREQIAASAAQVQQHRAEAQAESNYSVLLNLLGLQRAESALQIDERLPMPVVQQFDVSTLQSWALTQRLDISAMREALQAAQQQLDHVHHWRWVGGAEIGVEREHDRGDTAATGPAVNLELPLFNQGGGALMRGQAQVERLAASLAVTELSARNNVVSQLAVLSHARQVVDQYQHSLVPLHDQIILLSQQRYNYMLIGAPELLLAKQQALDAHQAYIEAVRDYWQAYIGLERIAGGKLPGDKPAITSYIDIDGLSDAVDMQSAPSTDH